MILELDQISKSFSGVSALKDVSITCDSGRIVAIIGPNGAGKTTLFNIICGFIEPDSGNILLRKTNITRLKSKDIARAGIGRLFQDIRVFENLSVMENLLVGFDGRPFENPIQAMLHPRAVDAFQESCRMKSHELLSLVGLTISDDLWAKQLSFGQQKLLAIARLLASQPDVILLDEPTAGIHPEIVEKILELMVQLAESGKTILVIEHNLSVILRVSHWVYLLDDGQIVAFGLPAEVLGDKALQSAYLGANH